MTFLNPLVLVGLAAASLPVLFHLFAQRKARRVQFTSLRFLQKLEKSSMRTVKIRQILLLIIRTLLVVAIVLAFARPALRGYLGSFFGSSHANTTLVILIDNSASMSRSDEHGELMKQAKESAKAIATLIEDGDDAVVIPIASIGHANAYALAHGRKELLDAIEHLSTVDRPASLADGLRMAAQALSHSQNVNKEVYLITDDQARNLQTNDSRSDSSSSAARASDTTGTLKLFDAGTRFFHISLGAGATERSLNLAIDSLKPTTTIYEPGRPVQFDAWIRNTTDLPAQNAVLSLFYNDERVAQQSVPSVAPNSSERVNLTGPTRGAGLIGVRAELEQDQLPFDNRRFTLVNVPSTRHIALFVQNPNDAIFVKLAIEQTLTEGGAPPFTTEVHSPAELRSLASFQSRLDGIMVFLDGRLLDKADADGLKDFIASGNGATLFLMPGIDPSEFNTKVAQALGLPQMKVKSGTASDNSHYASFAQIDFSHPFFSGMFDQKSVGGSALRGIESPKFYEYYTMSVPRSTQLISLSTGATLLSESRMGRGDLLLFSVPPTLQFSDLPRKSIFLPLMRRTAAYISAVKARADENVRPQYLTTDAFDVILPELRGVQPGSTLLIKSPDGTSERAQVVVDAEGKPRFHMDAARLAGNYQVFLDAEARDPATAFAVNIESNESDLRRAQPAEMESFLRARMSGNGTVVELDPSSKDLAQRIITSRYGVELWQAFLAAALLLAIAEMLVAREARIRPATVG